MARLSPWKRTFLEFLLDNGVIKIETAPRGSRETTNYPVNPISVDFSALDTKQHSETLGAAYAHAINAYFGQDFDVVLRLGFYENLTTAVTAAKLLGDLGPEMEMRGYHGEARWRSETKKELRGRLGYDRRIMVIDETAGLDRMVDEVLQALHEMHDLEVAGLVTLIDYMEATPGQQTTVLEELLVKYGVTARGIVTASDIVEYLAETGRATFATKRAMLECRDPDKAPRPPVALAVKQAVLEYYTGHGSAKLLDSWGWHELKASCSADLYGSSLRKNRRQQYGEVRV